MNPEIDWKYCAWKNVANIDIVADMNSEFHHVQPPRRIKHDQHIITWMSDMWIQPSQQGFNTERRPMHLKWLWVKSPRRYRKHEHLLVSKIPPQLQGLLGFRPVPHGLCNMVFECFWLIFMNGWRVCSLPYIVSKQCNPGTPTSSIGSGCWTTTPHA